MRLFVAIELPQELRRELGALTEELKERLPPARWVARSNFHLTLHFLGEQDEEAVPPLREQLERAFLRHRTIDFEVSGGGGFPRRRTRVVWIGLEAPTRLMNLQRDVVVASGVRPGGEGRRKPFRPHVTLARCRGPWSEAAVARLRTGLEPLRGRTFSIDHGTLFESVLTPAGARYTPLAVLPLAESREATSDF